MFVAGVGQGKIERACGQLCTMEMVFGQAFQVVGHIFRVKLPCLGGALTVQQIDNGICASIGIDAAVEGIGYGLDAIVFYHQEKFNGITTVTGLFTAAVGVGDCLLAIRPEGGFQKFHGVGLPYGFSGVVHGLPLFTTLMGFYKNCSHVCQYWQKGGCCGNLSTYPSQ